MVSLSENYPISLFDELSEFLRQAYREDIAIADRKIFAWQYQKDRQDRYFNVLHARLDNQLIGIYGYVPVDGFSGNTKELKKISFVQNWFVQDKHRGSVGWAMVRKTKKMFDAMLTVGMTEKTVEMVISDGWCVGDMTRLVCQINDTYRTGDNVSILDLHSFAPNWHLYDSLKHSVVRNAEYLNWRYVLHPAFDYRLLRCGASSREAVCVYREEQAFGAFEGIVFKVIEFFHPSDKQGRLDGLNLLAFIANEAKEQNALYMDFVCTSAEYLETMRLFGFAKDFDCKYPSRLTPVQYMEENFNIGVWSKDGIYPDIGDIYLTRGDADADRSSSVNLL